jgi:hypothetical protein
MQPGASGALNGGHTRSACGADTVLAARPVASTDTGRDGSISAEEWDVYMVGTGAADSDGDGSVSSGELALYQRVYGASRSLGSPPWAVDADYRCSPDELALARSRYGRQHPVVSVIDLLPRREPRDDESANARRRWVASVLIDMNPAAGTAQGLAEVRSWTEDRGGGGMRVVARVIGMPFL